MSAHLAPQKCECPAATGQTQAEASKHDEILRDSREECKAQATLAARLALLGYALHEIHGGGYLVARWDRTAHFSDLTGVRQFLVRVEGQK